MPLPVREIKANNRQRWKKFVRRNLLMHLIPNVTLNTIIPYFALKTQNEVHLFSGEQNLARFLLPMSLLLPFLITVDVLKKIRALQHTEPLPFACNNRLAGNAGMFKLAGLHSLYTVSAISFMLLLIYLSFPENFDFGIITSTVLAGILAGLYSIAFFFLSIKKVREVT